MDANLRKDLKRKIMDISADFGIEKILIDSYVRQMTETLQVSAIDEAYSISALLEFPCHINSFNDEKEIEMDRQFSKHQLSNQNDTKENINSRNAIHKQMLEKQQKD